MEVHQLKTGEDTLIKNIFLIQDEILITLSDMFRFVLLAGNQYSVQKCWYYSTDFFSKIHWFIHLQLYERKSVLIVLLSCNFSCMNNLRYCSSYTVVRSVQADLK
ncbi:hypothetical protein T06_10884 [Trichinella sp. T6]|nr:hypothetical protein T06_10884 [Trichinella sp. T6]